MGRTEQADPEPVADTGPSVSEALRPLTDAEFSCLQSVGARWREELPAAIPPLPIDPSLERASSAPAGVAVTEIPFRVSA